LQILQMPRQELEVWVREEVEKNPLLELFEPVSVYSKEPSELPDLPSLYKFLCQEIHDTISNPLEQKIAKHLIGYLDEKGFLSTPVEEIARQLQIPLEKILHILRIIQSFDPPGIGARTIQESWLLQLQRRQETNSIAYRLAAVHFENLLHSRYSQIKKKMQINAEELASAMHTLSRLQLRPGGGFKVPLPLSAIPDLIASKIDHKWSVEIPDEEFPLIQIRKDLQDFLPKLAAGEKKTVKQWMTSAKWLLRSLNRRKNLLRSIASHLLDKQADYLEQKNPLQKITVPDLAELLAVHESTIHRALHEKLIEGPWGLIPLRSLLSQPATIDHCKQTLKQLIGHENKKQPLTDEELASLLKGQGIMLARRTIAKYRKELKLGSASQRKHHQ